MEPLDLVGYWASKHSDKVPKRMLLLGFVVRDTWYIIDLYKGDDGLAPLVELGAYGEPL